MKFKRLIQFEPIDLTKIIIYIAIISIVILVFNQQLTNFFEDLRKRPITFTMTPSGTTISFDAPVVPNVLTAGIYDPSFSSSRIAGDIEHWEEELKLVSNIEQLGKLGFDELYRGLESLEENEIGVLNYIVNDPEIGYFGDESMLKYISIASEKIRYLAFYYNNRFEGYIKIERVIKGLASGEYQFKDFGTKLKNSRWLEFPGLIGSDEAFIEIPTILELYEKLVSSNYSEFPLIENGILKAILNYETVANGLYEQSQSLVKEAEQEV